MVPLIVGLAIACVASGQTGPTKARVVEAFLPQPYPDSSLHTRLELKTVLELDVGPDGRVTGARIAEPSADPKFDQRVIKYYQKFRFVPAIDLQGIPIASTFRMTYKIAGDNTDVSSRAAYDPNTVNDEVARISRMACKDFLWEYDLMKEIAGKHSINREQLFNLSVALYIAKHKVVDRDLAQVGQVRDDAIRDAIEKCRANPAEKFWSGIFDPAMSARLGH